MILRSNGRILDCDGIKRSKPYPSKRNSSSDLKTNADGSVDRYFGPEAPKGLENNWVDTRPSKGFFVWFRSYENSVRQFAITFLGSNRIESII
jgi:hypothetical protein